MTNKLIYVASGCNFLSLPRKVFTENKNNLDFLFKTFDLVKNENHDFGLLFNALTEKKFGPIFEKTYRKNVSGIYADSGGLQTITLGKEVNDELKTNIFETQAKYSDYGMCFDTIPVTSTSETSKRGSELSTRYFDESKLEECARDTGRNVQKQIDIMKANPERGAKPFIILQGSDENSYTKWFDYLISEINPNDLELIDSVAIGSAALGAGKREDINKIFFFNLIKHKINIKNVHFLGVGTISRIIPIIACNELLKDYTISYDSTTHTMAPHFGYYCGMDAKNYKKLSSKDSSDKSKVYNDIKKNVPFYNNTLDEFWEDFKITTFLPEHDVDRILRTYTSFIMSGIVNFQKTIDQLNNDKDYFDSMNGKYAMAYSTLREVRDVEDFREWHEKIGNVALPSKKIRGHKPSTFGELI